MPCLQNKEGQEARGLTGQESLYKLERMRRKAHSLFCKRPQDFGFALRFSWDGASGHKSAEEDMTILREQIVHPPAKSPDIQRAIENPHSVIHREFNKRLSADRRIKCVADAVELLKKVVKDKVDIEHVRPLIDGLPETYRNIVLRHGDWAERGRR